MHMWGPLFVGGLVCLLCFVLTAKHPNALPVASDSLLRKLGGGHDPPPTVEAEEARPASHAATS